MANTNLGIVEPTPQDPAQTNIWAATVNTNMTLIDNAIAGLASVSCAGGSNVVLTSTAGTPNQYRNGIVALTGTITSNIAVLWPAGITIPFRASNGTSGAFSVSLGVNNGSSAVAGVAVTIPHGALGNFYSDGTNVYSIGSAFQTRQVLTSGTAYTTPAGCTRLFIRMMGAGGGGQGASASTLGGAGGTGGDSSFNSIVAKGGPGGASFTSGTTTHGSGSASLRILGGIGVAGSAYSNPNPVDTEVGGMMGAASPFGGAGGANIGGGISAAANSGSGAGGAAYADTMAGGNYQALGGSGCAGEYVELIINGPAASYTYAIGAGGTAGSGTLPGGVGGAGIIIVDEFY